MGLYDNRRSNISKQSAQSKALKRQKAAERRDEQMTRDPVVQQNWPGVDIASTLARMDLSQRRHVAGLRARLEEGRAELEAQIARRVAAEARAAEANRRLAELHVTNTAAGG